MCLTLQNSDSFTNNYGNLMFVKPAMLRENNEYARCLFCINNESLSSNLYTPFTKLFHLPLKVFLTFRGISFLGSGLSSNHSHTPFKHEPTDV